jgi:hypothetical protein
LTDSVAVDAKRILLRYGAPIAVLDKVSESHRIDFAREIAKTMLPEREPRLRQLLFEHGYTDVPGPVRKGKAKATAKAAPPAPQKAGDPAAKEGPKSAKAKSAPAAAPRPQAPSGKSKPAAKGTVKPAKPKPAARGTAKPAKSKPAAKGKAKTKAKGKSKNKK